VGDALCILRRYCNQPAPTRVYGFCCHTFPHPIVRCPDEPRYHRRPPRRARGKGRSSSEADCRTSTTASRRRERNQVRRRHIVASNASAVIAMRIMRLSSASTRAPSAAPRRSDWTSSWRRVHRGSWLQRSSASVARKAEKLNHVWASAWSSGSPLPTAYISPGTFRPARQNLNTCSKAPHCPQSACRRHPRSSNGRRLPACPPPAAARSRSAWPHPRHPRPGPTCKLSRAAPR
jgi:hypothetical protein